MNRLSVLILMPPGTERIDKRQQGQIDALKKLVCSQSPQAEVCEENEQ